MEIKYMELAIAQAKRAAHFGDVPVGAVIICNNKVIAKAYNKKEKCQNALYHAEVLAINKASKKLKNFRLTDCTIYVTKEPCLMCMGALLSARIGKIVFGSYDKKFGASHLATENNFNHKCEVEGGVLEPQTSELLSSFFEQLRNNKQQKDN